MSSSRHHHRSWPSPSRAALLLGLITSTTLAGCLGRDDGTHGADVAITMTTTPTKLTVAPTRIVVTIKDRAGQPVDGATLTLRGDMTMAGMTPLVVTTSGVGHGRYVAGPVTFGMGGDWIISIKGRLANGRSLSHQFPPLHVASP